jgi:hypothetical protein
MGEKSLEITNFSGKKIPQVAKSHHKKKLFACATQAP